MTDRLQAGAYAAWDEFYKQMAITHKYIKGRGNGPWNHTNAKQFEAIAQGCIDAELSVAKYIETAIGVLRRSNKRFITPHDLAAADLMTTVVEILAGGNSQADYAAHWHRQMTQLHRLLTTQPDIYPDAVSALMVPMTSFDAWFRVLLITPFNEELFQVYGEAARQELLASRTLRDFLRKQTPDNLRALEKRTTRFEDG